MVHIIHYFILLHCSTEFLSLYIMSVQMQIVILPRTSEELLIFRSCPLVDSSFTGCVAVQLSSESVTSGC